MSKRIMREKILLEAWNSLDQEDLIIYSKISILSKIKIVPEHFITWTEYNDSHHHIIEASCGALLYHWCCFRWVNE